MDRLLNAVMDLVVPPASMVMLAFAWPTRGVKTLTKEDMLGKVVVITGASSAIGEAAKAAAVDFYETLRYEVKDEVGVTVATHGWVGGDAGGGKFTLDHHQEGATAEMQWKQEEREAAAAALPGGAHVKAYARALVAGACRGDAYVKRPSWYDVFLVFRVFAPDVLAWTFRLLLSSTPAAGGGGPTTSAITARRPPPAALPAPPVRPLLEYPTAASRRPAQMQKLE